jgi:hypothetical protein
VFVAADDRVIHIEGVNQLLFGDDDGRERSERVAHAEFIKGVGIRSREINNDNVGLQQLLVHQCVNRSAVRNLVCADAVQSSLLDGGFNHIMIRRVEVERTPGLIVGLCAVAHHDKASLLIFRHG